MSDMGTRKIQLGSEQAEVECILAVGIWLGKVSVTHSEVGPPISCALIARAQIGILKQHGQADLLCSDSFRGADKCMATPAQGSLEVHR